MDIDKGSRSPELLRPMRLAVALAHLPAMLWAAIAGFVSNLLAFVVTRRRSFTFLDGKMEVYFLGGALADFVPLVFGEAFWTIRYDGYLIDPGGPAMRRSLRRHLDRLPPRSIDGVLATHGHEEHAGNVAAAAEYVEAPIWCHPSCEAALRDPPNLSLPRRLVIGQPRPCQAVMESFTDRLSCRTTTLEVFAAPGHCDDQIVLYDPVDKVLLAGDAFVSETFTTPNADVDSIAWIASMKRLERLDIEVLVTGHGHIFTLREDIPDVPGVVVRRDPSECLADKRRFMEMLRGRIADGASRGLTTRQIRRRLFSHGGIGSRRGAFLDLAAYCLSLGEFSRDELIRTYRRRPER